MRTIALVKPQSVSEKRTQTVVDTIMVTPETVAKWKSPGFQRPVRQNDKVLALAEALKHDGGVWPGIITLGVLGGDVYIIDGQHRREAFVISGLAEGYTDVRRMYATSMAEMGEEFVRLNSQLVRMRPDDILRGLDDAVPALQRIRSRCPFVGYDMIRRGPRAPMVSMSAVLRQWRGSLSDIPQSFATGVSTAQMAETLSDEEAENLCDFLTLAVAAFGRDTEYARLWAGLNLILCMWLYRRLVLTQYSPKSPRLTKDMFKKCLMSVTANSDYIDWLLGRHLGERDRSPAYTRIKQAFAQRIYAETSKKPMLPQPAWHGRGN